jgi:hypothetical protein
MGHSQKPHKIGFKVTGNHSRAQSLIIEFEYAGRFEIVTTHHGVSETTTRLGLYQVLISRNIGEPWEISFIQHKLEIEDFPIYMSIQTLSGEIIYSSVLVAQESMIDIDCVAECNVVIVNSN